MSNPNSKEEYFIPIKEENDAKRLLTPERLFRHKKNNKTKPIISPTEPIIIPTENEKRAVSAPTIPANIYGVIEPKERGESEKDLQRYLILKQREEESLKQREEELSSKDSNKYAFPTFDTNQTTKSKMGQQTNLEKQKKRQTRLLRSDNRRKSALTMLMDEKEEKKEEQEENKAMKKEDKKGGKRRKTRKSTKSKKRRTKKKKPQFLYNPNDPKKSFDVYIDKNPDDTITIKYTTVDDVKNTIQKLEKLYKNNKYSHKRIWQVGMIMKVRLEAMLKNKHLYPNAKNVKSRYDLSNKYFKFLGKRSQEKDDNKRKKMTFKS
jgi:hypothetical protein